MLRDLGSNSQLVFFELEMGWKRDLFAFLVHVADFVAGESSNTSSNLQIESDVNILTERPPLHKLWATKQKLQQKLN